MSSGIARSALSALAGLMLLALTIAAQAPGAMPQAGNPQLHVQAALPGYVRVVLSDSGTTQAVGGTLQWYDGTRLLGKSDKSTEVALNGDRARVRLGGSARDARRLVAIPVDGYALYGGKSYRGRFELFAGQDGGLVVLNVLPLEDYLQGVVPSEMPAAWAPEALRAQAVAARTYAVSRIAGRVAQSYDVYATVADQAYRGVSGEAESTNEAVRDTAGLVLAYAGAPITAMYCSDAGGCTLRGNEPYLQAVASYAPGSKYNSWQLALTIDQLVRMADADGVQLGPVKQVRAENDAVSGHLLQLTVLGGKSQWSIGGKELRKRLGYTTLRSTRALLYPASAAGGPPPAPRCDASGLAQQCFAPEAAERAHAAAKPGAATEVGLGHNAAALPDSPVRGAAPLTDAAAITRQSMITTIEAADAKAGLVLVGCGNGHGVGLSQYGANELASQGWDYRAILLYFYRGAALARLPADFTGNGREAEYCYEDAPGTEAVSVDFYTPYVPQAGRTKNR